MKYTLEIRTQDKIFTHDISNEALTFSTRKQAYKVWNSLDDLAFNQGRISGFLWDCTGETPRLVKRL